MRSSRPSLRLGRHWVERLAWQAGQWGRVHSPRHVERRIKSCSGRSLRAWQSLVRTKGLVFAARERHEAGLPFVKRVSGFSPTEFAQRFIDDESFWMYRLWVWPAAL